jgi:hypothetical protein
MGIVGYVERKKIMFSKEETLRKAIDKAIRNGWNPKDFTKGTSKEKGKYILKITNDLQIRSIVLSHDFARAFWGTRKIGHNFLKGEDTYEWQRRLSEMVLEEDPLSYLAKFLEDEQ